MRRINLIRLGCLVFLATLYFPTGSLAKSNIVFGPNDTDIKASIRYTVIGIYNSAFKNFQGNISYDPATNTINSVYLELEAETITSSCGWCDKIVRSKQLLATQQFPTITFKSTDLLENENGYQVKGLLDLHGVQKEYILPYDLKVIENNESDQKQIQISGLWEINRKDFDIIWNRVLDKGGILVGNTITVDWSIVSPI